MRPARAADADLIADLQARAWRSHLTAVLGPAAGVLDAEQAAHPWRRAITEPPSDAHRVLVAIENGTVVGFAAVAPCPDTDDGPPEGGEVVALEVDPGRTGAGHGSRLLAAVADLLREDGVPVVRAWSLAEDGPRALFLHAAGLRPDGLRRLLDVEGRPFREDRWSAAL